jgi:hypothetical protein
MPAFDGWQSESPNRNNSAIKKDRKKQSRSWMNASGDWRES